MANEFDYASIIADPNLMDPEYDISNIRTTTPTSERLLAAVPEYSGLQFDPTQQSVYSDLYSLYSGGLPTIPVARDTAQIPGTVDTSVETGGGGLDVVDTPVDVNTPFEQNLIDQGIGVQGAPGDPVVAPGEMPVTQEEMDAFNQIPVTPANLQDPTTMLPQIPEVVAQDPTTMMPQLGSETPSYAGGEKTLQDAGAGIDDVYGTDYGFGTEEDFVQNEDLIDRGNPLNDSRIQPEEFGLVPDPEYTDQIMDPNLMDIRQQQAQEGLTTEQNNTLQNIIGQAGQTVEGAMNQLSKIPGAVADFANQTVDIFGKKFNVGKTLLSAGINKLAGGPISLVFDLLPQDSLANTTTRSIVDELKAENDYGYNMQSGNLNQDPFGRNPVSAFGDYEQTLMDDLAGTGKWANLQTAEMTEAKKQFAQDYFNKKAEKAGGAEVEDGVVLGPGEAPGEDLVTAEELAEQKFQDEIDAGIAAADEEPSPTVTTPTFTPRGGGADRDPAPTPTFEPRGGGADRDPAPSSPAPRDTGSDYGQFDRAVDRSTPDYSGVTTGGPPSRGGSAGGPPSQGGGGGGGNNKKIVCTMMNESYGFGSFRNKIWIKYARDHLSPEYQIGYHKIFLPLVRLSKTNKLLKKTLEHIAVHRTIDIRQEARGKVHLLGRVYRKILEPICYIVGKYAKR
jgi:hypothetical protein